MTAMYFFLPCTLLWLPLAKQTNVMLQFQTAKPKAFLLSEDQPVSSRQFVKQSQHVWIDIQRLLRVIIIASVFPSTLLTHIHLYKGVPEGICNKIQFLTLPDTGRKTVLFPESLCGKREEIRIEITCSFVLEELKGIIEMVILCKGRRSREWGNIWKKIMDGFLKYGAIILQQH